ncbi:RNA methyltransferase [Deinococcus taeanensis]|uniref:TrmH family RNA methyltransferase n=1 Tax=Deinococcus taeanensis TaxID=2737050 RepID=UPI001CDBE898|nr:RNA methyltransferase [Deinococcus taeanensis]UBV43864.1 RNA methyltransferase [Deinococcus taeanensis]
MSAPEVITSLQNAHVKRLVRLRSRRDREQEGVIVIEGAREIARAVSSGVSLSAVYSAPDLHSAEAAGLAPTLQAPGALLSRAAFGKVSGRENPDGLIALAPTPRVTLPEPGPQAVTVLLHGLEKPGNVGAILRSADAAGADSVIVLGRGADPYGPNVIRASQGSVFTLPVAVMTEHDAQAWLAARQFTTFACTPDAPRAYWDAPLTGRVALLLGTEHEGLPAQWRQTDHSVSIPMNASRGADSLNVATAAALMLFECARQRRRRSA